jgi:hypothetical protein
MNGVLKAEYFAMTYYQCLVLTELLKMPVTVVLLTSNKQSSWSFTSNSVIFITAFMQTSQIIRHDTHRQEDEHFISIV